MLINEIITEDVSSIVCIHHNDNDGIAAALTLSMYIKNNYPALSLIRSKYIKADYAQVFDFSDTEVFNKNTVVFIVDFSLSFKDMEALYRTVGTIVWIDHHKSAIENIWQPNRADDDIENPAKIYMLLHPTMFCGAELTWIFLHTGLHLQFKGLSHWIYKNMQYYEHNENGELYCGRADQLLPDSYMNMLPEWLKITGDWDIYRRPTEDVFKYKMWFETYVKIGEDGSYLINPEDIPVEECIETMINAYDFYMNQLEQYVRIYATECKISRFHEIHAVMLPIPNIIGSRAFSSIRDKYEVGVLMHYNGKVFQYSVYRLDENPEKFIDCSEIARMYKGGGHAGAAGFRTHWEVVRPIV